MICIKCKNGGKTEFHPFGGGTAPFHDSCYREVVSKKKSKDVTGDEFFVDNLLPLADVETTVPQCLCRWGVENDLCPFSKTENLPKKEVAA